MIRSLLAAFVLLFAAACQPGLKIDAENPFATLQPWDSSRPQVERITLTGNGVVEQLLGENQFVSAADPSLTGGRFAGGVIKWTGGANAGKESKIGRHAAVAFELAEGPAAPVAIGDAFEVTSATIEYVVIKKGEPDGLTPGAADRVTVNYDGRLASDGKKFDSSYDRGEPATFRLNEVIPGWTEGLQKMRKGDEFMFWIPAALGYGAEGAGGDIPPNSDLMFRVALLEVEKAPASSDAAWTKARPWPSDSSDVIRTASGLEYMVIESGAPDRQPASLELQAAWQRECFRIDPSGGACAVVHFRGELDDKSEVVSTFAEQQEQVFPVAQLVQGWAETLGQMRPGDRWMVRMPPHLLYGPEGDGRIPPSATVTFEILVVGSVEVPKMEVVPAPNTPEPEAAPQ